MCTFFGENNSTAFILSYQSNRTAMKNKLIHCLLLCLASQSTLWAQLPYTEKSYGVFVEKAIYYGTATNFAGGQTDLLLDLYKPIGDNNCQRPLIVMVHGGAFIAGTRNDYDVVQLCQEMAARGYVAASIEYRLGMHLEDYYEPYAICNDAINPFDINKCVYMQDTMEMVRAMYRATQDLRGAVRFLKNRHDLDSTDVQNVFVGGSSAGAITSLSMAMINHAGKRPPFTEAIDDALAPDPDLADCLPIVTNQFRPDLGDYLGNLNLGGHDDSVQGVAAFMGAVFDLGILDDNAPPLYLYHRSNDIVVPWDHRPLLEMFPVCLAGVCMPHYTRPWVHGSQAIAVAAQGAGAPATFNDLLDDGPPDWFACVANPFGHVILNIHERCANLSGFFAPIIAANGNAPTANCTSGLAEKKATNQFTVYPNPVAQGTLDIRCPNCPDGTAQYRLFDNTGQLVNKAVGSSTNFSWEIGALPNGVYTLHAFQEGQFFTGRVTVIGH